MKKILVVLTGGTIGSCVQGNVISAKVERSAEIVERYEKRYGKEDFFEVVQPINELSENLHPGSWEPIIEVLDEAIDKDYDGIIVTHGSDTLAYTSAFMSLHYAYVKIPIVFIAANYPLDDERSNGLKNFSGAITFIHEQAASGVYNIYENMNSEVEVFLPTRMLGSDPFFDQYQSFDRQVFGWIKKGKFLVNEECPVTLEMVRNRETEHIARLYFQYENEVLFIPMYQGINFRNYKCTDKTKAVLLYLYHSATGATNEEAGLLEFLAECHKQEVKVYGASFKSENMNVYQTTHVLLKEGLIPMFNISSVAAYVKLVMAYNQKNQAPEAVLEENRFFEKLTK
ncbi:asparaginase domain-containing protein [[Clostridium] polysaccharolyticum]|uniref:L-asparaginase n=1 Tax=[Clostridium] polysaccharolyticum TaxID=29364 RepID=A0A1I0E9P0_9FIRM|nr:asparaginase domain-containing protein [[Clostridium] polysaccharolyticum]SET41740.1 L-asparaginase [[Clostridium] polysaccharolyticum]